MRWWMIHRDRVWTLCWELLSSPSFFSRADSEKDDMPVSMVFPRVNSTELQPSLVALSSKLKLSLFYKHATKTASKRQHRLSLWFPPCFDSLFTYTYCTKLQRCEFVYVSSPPVCLQPRLTLAYRAKQPSTDQCRRKLSQTSALKRI